MTRRADLPQTRAEFLSADGVLLVVREAPPAPPPVKGQPALVAGNPIEGDEVLLAVWDDGSASALNGHVDLGTGIQTALGQIVAEELDLGMPCVRVMLGDTARVPNQGATIASASIQIHSQPLRLAAAQARGWLLARAAEKLGVPCEALQVRNGVVRVTETPERHVGYAELVAGQRTVLRLDTKAQPKDPADYRVVGTRQARVDIPAKLAGELVFVHDMRVPGMLHGRVVRPPYAGADHGEFIGNTLEAVDESSIAHIPGIRAVVVVRDFVGIVAEREEHAEQALRELRVTWKPWPGMPDLSDVAQALRDNPSTQRLLVDEGDVDGAIAAAAQPMQRTYVWPYQMHASIGPSCALADWQPDDGSGMQLRCWAGSQNPHVLRVDLARLMGVEDVQVDVVRMEAAGCYGRNGADDVAADAALLARAVGAPVRVQLTREQEHAWEPKGAAQLMEIDGGLMADGRVAAYDFETSYPSNGAPTLALLLTRTIEPVAQAYEMGDRTARPPYSYDNLRVKVNDMAPIVRASWLRGVSALPSSFAHESYIDELATAAGVDPVQFRLRHLEDPRAIELVQATAQKAGWRMRTGPQENADGGLGEGGDILFGQGFAYARYIHSKWPGFGAAWAAWVADVEVNRKTGEVHVRRVVVGHDAGLMINPAGVEHQVHGNVIQTTSRALKERVQFAPQQQQQGDAPAGGALLPGVLPSGVVASRDWGSYPIINFREVPVIEVMHMPRPGEPSLGAGESSSVPGTAAIANAIFDATGVRFRSPPFTPETVLAGLSPLTSDLPPLPPGEGWGEGRQPASGDAVVPPFQPSPGGGRSNAVWPRRKGLWATGAALVVGGIGVIAGLLGWRSAIAPVSLTAPVYSQSTIERGRVLAAAGDCAVCHTAAGGAPNAGGRAMDTPFGTLYTTNLTPDAETGLGRWSFSAFQRAMREGVSRDGHYLYPAFPYTAFAKTSDDDLQALYAYFMSMPAVRAQTPKSELKFPFSMRPLMAGWNALFHDPAPLQPVAAQSAEWNRGAYLVNGLGHCGACHTPRNALGAEQGGEAFLSGAMVDGWEAPALTQLSKSALPWDADELYRYLRHGHTQRHGIAGGPMAEVVRELQQVPDEDVRAMATYLGSFNPAPVAQPQAVAEQAVDNAARTQGQLLGPAQRMFDSACAACHHDGNGPTLLGVNTPLALNSNLTSARPDNLLRTILDGVREPATRDIGFMPAFREALDDRQIADLAGYMRARFAPQEPAWKDLPAEVARVRATPGH
ncbi:MULTISPECIES: molybdopterin cofactor-binding domain-containing protein [unclassified Variovorax]|uniref:molybdopterin cofactor-binding domain-containing protein n=1 Tax=unclassified Variovorax TaxID=663243 RepID=UPI0008D715AB|nr:MULTISPECIES: molybdopterin cofactor-binding domain-containing protein [unclassified Variovorax]SEJ85647.1 nicotinate dehydrogenase subunit B [Variovorax sp. OK202]SFD01035.1 nicotinate dehydrogenase subunit B [Variovorax sp. OK212]